jgi:hypothetical protein
MHCRPYETKDVEAIGFAVVISQSNQTDTAHTESKREGEEETRFERCTPTFNNNGRVGE